MSEETNVGAANAAALIAKYGAKEEDREFTFTLDEGETFRGRKIMDAGALLSLEKRVNEFQALLKSGLTPPEWEEFLPVEPEVAKLTTYMTDVLIEPAYTTLDCLRMAREIGPVFIIIGYSLINGVNGNIGAALGAALEESKNA